MLQFIVLGQIPGTEIYVPFKYVAVVLTLIILTICVYKIASPFRHYKKRMQEVFDTAI